VVVAVALATADTARTLALSKAAVADTVPTATLATARHLATEDSHLLQHHLCGPDTALTIARTKDLNATVYSADANFAMVAEAVADSAAVAALAVSVEDALAIQTVDVAADAEQHLAVAVAELLTLALYAADISVAAAVD